MHLCERVCASVRPSHRRTSWISEKWDFQTEFEQKSIKNLRLDLSYSFIILSFIHSFNYSFIEFSHWIHSFIYISTPSPSAEEAYIADLDAKSGASLKLTILNKSGRIWTMVAGGGASVIYSDTICDLGGTKELANYGEYSGAPSEQQTWAFWLWPWRWYATISTISMVSCMSMKTEELCWSVQWTVFTPGPGTSLNFEKCNFWTSRVEKSIRENQRTMVKNRKKHRQNRHPIILCPTSEWAVRANEQTDERVA